MAHTGIFSFLTWNIYFKKGKLHEEINWGLLKHNWKLEKQHWGFKKVIDNLLDIPWSAWNKILLLILLKTNVQTLAVHLNIWFLKSALCNFKKQLVLPLLFSETEIQRSTDLLISQCRCSLVDSEFGPQHEFAPVHQYIASPQKQDILMPSFRANHCICFYFKPRCYVNAIIQRKRIKIKHTFICTLPDLCSHFFSF